MAAKKLFSDSETATASTVSGPGTGKTFLSKLLRKAAGFRGIKSKFCAFAGVAAKLDPDGVTLHHLGGM